MRSDAHAALDTRDQGVGVLVPNVALNVPPSRLS